ncbi:hypothetical protein Ancab_030064 [Ancistrocladus abbreviatus]
MCLNKHFTLFIQVIPSTHTEDWERERKKMKEHQVATTANKEHSVRRSKYSSLEKPQKFTKKSLNAAFASVAGDASNETKLESIDDLSLTFGGKSNRDSIENMIVALDKPLSASSENLTPSNFTSNGSRTISADQSRTFDINSLKIRSVEAEVVAHHLEQARIRVLRSKNVDQESKKLLDALINMLMLMKEFYGLCAEKDLVDQLISAILCLLLWMLIFAVILVSSSVDQSSFCPPPT